MKTFQDLQRISDNIADRMAFVNSVISDHKSSDLYKTAKIADKYFKHQNVTIEEFQKFLYTVTGKVIPDNWSANYKLENNLYFYFIVQEVQYLLGNGVTFKNEDTESKLGTKEKSFDNQIKKIAEQAKNAGVSFGFFNQNYVDDFSVLEFAPLYDEIDGSLKAGVRFWQVDASKPLRATLYEIDGHTDFIWLKKDTPIEKDWIKISDGQYYKEKQSYTDIVETSNAYGDVIVDGENYPSFPIVPMWGNPEKQSAIVGMRSKLDALDLILSGMCNTIDEASIVYWTLTNAGGMDDVDLAKFIERLKTTHAATVDDEIQVDSHSIDPPIQGRETTIERLKKELFTDAMALNVEQIASGNVTATQIRAAYEPLNEKTDRFESCVSQFVDNILAVAGIEDVATFTRSKIVNVSEEITTVIQASGVLPQEFIVEKVLTLLGDKDRFPEVIKQIQADSIPIVDDE